VTGERKFMTGKPGRLPTKLVDQIAEGHIALGYGALVYDITHKPPGRTEWE
jgi:GMP synthase PP-ATPase subunit